MTDKEKEEINKLKEKYQTEFLDDYELRFIFNVVKKQQEEIEKYKYLYQKALDNTIKADRDNLKKDKIIDEMAKYIEDESTVDEFCSKENCYADDYENGHCRKCLNCIKEYFIHKVEKD